MTALFTPSSTPAPRSQKNKQTRKAPPLRRTARPLRFLLPYLALFSASTLYSRDHVIDPIPWTYASDNPQVLASQHSVTGLVKVVEYQFAPGSWLRALKVDHSLLGGLWIGPARQQWLQQTGRLIETITLQDERAAVDMAQSIFNNFYMQEAVRLADRPSTSDKSPKALIM